MTVSPNQQSSEDRAAVILTPDQRVRVFVSSTLEELAEERAAALPAIRRLHLVPVWYESGARPHPPQSMSRAYVEQSQIFAGIYWQLMAGWVQAWRSRVWRMSSGWPLGSRCCLTPKTPHTGCTPPGGGRLGAQLPDPLANRTTAVAKGQSGFFNRPSSWLCPLWEKTFLPDPLIQLE